MATAALPLFHLYGDPPDDQAFDFIHIETIASRSSIHDWTIRAHRHRNLFQILLIERGGGEMTFEAASLDFAAPAAILVPPTTAHGALLNHITGGHLETIDAGPRSYQPMNINFGLLPELPQRIRGKGERRRQMVQRALIAADQWRAELGTLLEG